MSNKYEFETIENIDDKTRLRSNSVKSDNIKVGVRQRSSTTLSFWSVGTDNKSNNDKLRRGSTSGKEVSLPAWMFLRLLPFYTDDNVITNELQSVVKTSKEFATRRPILPICLKRYRFNSGAASGTRSQKRIIIPPFIDLPQFVADDIDDNSCSFILILEVLYVIVGIKLNWVISLLLFVNILIKLMKLNKKQIIQLGIFMMI